MSIAIPLYIFLFVYLIFIAVFLAFSIINFYHIVVAASFTIVSFTISFFIFALTLLTLYLTYTLLVDINWQQTLLVFDTGWFTGPSGTSF
ncbi:MAG: hypothetical protein COV60_02340 [Candidatus Magasanikbacteria bacterium CG11_big_fil_rev_8_21_14_0_20_43_7]|uniref:Uncharacterized protein n=1 Tax=Candidatus Magasanikbacteria bacterium CG11_big_fil_rev_8_21_14_0_20_43_7 TaxID=1974654 RepID=A0A2H0N2D9_9BACT|nr:MAG: hypothetical protein COV60_02340 [Candidatus Magasanikbacteria bacterium CG11_big_fil_rev_8_21_14_0_20_43_7]